VQNQNGTLLEKLGSSPIPYELHASVSISLTENIVSKPISEQLGSFMYDVQYLQCVHGYSRLVCKLTDTDYSWTDYSWVQPRYDLSTSMYCIIDLHIYYLIGGLLQEWQQSCLSWLFTLFLRNFVSFRLFRCMYGKHP
jgi:hypothetical protein